MLNITLRLHFIKHWTNAIHHVAQALGERRIRTRCFNSPLTCRIKSSGCVRSNYDGQKCSCMHRGSDRGSDLGFDHTTFCALVNTWTTEPPQQHCKTITLIQLLLTLNYLHWASVLNQCELGMWISCTASFYCKFTAFYWHLKLPVEYCKYLRPLFRAQIETWIKDWTLWHEPCV